MISLANILHENKYSLRIILIYILCIIWSFRLGFFLFKRILERKNDFRFKNGTKYPGYLFFSFTMQGIWCFLVGYPIVLILLQCQIKTNFLFIDFKSKNFNIYDTIGFLLYIRLFSYT